MESTSSRDTPTFPHIIAKRNGRATIYRGERSKGGNTYLEFRLATYGTDGRRHLKTFPTFEKAVEAAEKKLVALGRGLVDTTLLSGPARLDYLNARKLLPATVGLTDAANAWLRTQEAHKSEPIPVPDLVTAFIASREAGTRRGKAASAAYRIDLRRRLGKFAEAFLCDVADVSVPAIEEWLGSAKQRGRNRFNTLRLIRTLMRWAQKRGHLPPGGIVTDKLEINAPSDDGPIEIFMPAELARLLAVAKPSLVPYLALGAFAGLRTAETARLDWADVKLERGFVEVRASAAKTASRRLVPVTPALQSWLAPIRRESGPVLPYANIGHQVGQLTRDAKVAWKVNALRHSFISYRVAEIQDVPKVALEAGNSPQMIFAHYRELVTPKEAQAWFGVIREPAQ